MTEPLRLEPLSPPLQLIVKLRVQFAYPGLLLVLLPNCFLQLVYPGLELGVFFLNEVGIGELVFPGLVQVVPQLL